MSLKKLHIFLSAAVICLLVACGGMELEQEAEPEVNKEEYAFKHGPGPGPPYTYYVTTFSGEKMACGGYASGWYYSTGEWMFGCGTKLKLKAANGKCVVVQVADNGPAAWVEAKAKAKCGGTGYILDVSPLATKHLWGVSGAGWSDCKTRKVQAWKVSKSTKLGPISCGATDPITDGTNWIGESCGGTTKCTSGLQCKEDYPSGMCTQSCTKYCPDRSGETTTFCTALDGANGQCYSRCDHNKFPSGCRAGYECVQVPRHNEPGVKKDACFPAALADQARSLSGDTGGEPTDNPGNSGDVWIGGPCGADTDCSDNMTCNTKDHENGMCTMQCPSSSICPDRAGEPVTFCIALDGSTGYCHSRCDYQRYSSGCRSGYTCSKLPRHKQSWVKRNTCVPNSAVGKADFVGEEPDEEGELPNPEAVFQQGCSVGSGALSGLPGLMIILLLGLVAARRRESRRP